MSDYVEFLVVYDHLGKWYYCEGCKDRYNAEIYDKDMKRLYKDHDYRHKKTIERESK